jgi:hypothetical protein
MLIEFQTRVVLNSWQVLLTTPLRFISILYKSILRCRNISDKELITKRSKSVNTVTRKRPGRPEFDSREGSDRIFSIRRLVQTGSWVHAAPYPMGTGRFISWELGCRLVKLTTHVLVELRLRIHGAVSPFPHTFL